MKHALAFATLFLVVLIAGIATANRSAQASPTVSLVFTVNNSADNPDLIPGDGVCETFINNHVCTLRGAIQEANAHAGADTINLASTTYLLTRIGYPDDTALLGDLDITDTVTINGAGANSTFIDGNGSTIGERVFQISGTVVISGVTIQRGQSSTIGGGLISTGRLTLINSTVLSNTSTDNGGGLYNSGQFTLINSAIISNTSTNITYTSVKVGGGGIFSSGPMTLTNSTISRNLAAYADGGGILNSGPLLILNSTFSDNSAQSSGGGIYNSGPLSLSNSLIMSNSVGEGGGIFNSGSLTLTNSLVNGNSASGLGYGGGIFNQGLLLMSNSTLSRNSADFWGGGLYNDVWYTATIVGSTINGNIATEGGGIYNNWIMTVTNSTVSRNYSSANGGGINNNINTTSLFNVTITGNRANADNTGVGTGGGVFNKTGNTLTFVNSIIALNENVVTPGPILYNDDCAGTITSQGYNILYHVNLSHCTVSGSPTLTQTNPQLGPLQNNGGRTQTHALLPGSPAIDAGNPSGCRDGLGALIPTDQRGFPRPANGGVNGLRCDIGAFEYYRFRVFLPVVMK